MTGRRIARCTLIQRTSGGWGFTSAEKQVASLKDRGIVLFSSTIFLFGVAIQLFLVQFTIQAA